MKKLFTLKLPGVLNIHRVYSLSLWRKYRKIFFEKYSFKNKNGNTHKKENFFALKGAQN